MAEQIAPPPHVRVRVFVDFWNFSLSIRGIDPNFRIDWQKLGNVLASEAAKTITPDGAHSYEGNHVYASYDPNKTGDAKLKSFLSNTLDKMTGVHVAVLERQKKRNYAKCPQCQVETQKCHACGADMRGTEEKGVDTRIATDMISLAWANGFNTAVLASADKDFVPVVEFLQTKGIKVIHAAFPPAGSHLSQKCWGSIDVKSLFPLISR